jgi:hypothetical protein
MQPPCDDVFRPDIVVARHDEMRQHRLCVMIRTFDATPVKPGELAPDPVRSEFTKNIELPLARSFSAPIGQVDDLTLFDAIDRGMRRVHEALQAFGQPMVAPSLSAIAVHALLHHDPVTVISDNEAVQIEVEPILHRRAVDLGDKPACLGERGTIEPDPIADRHQFMRRLARVIAAPAANMDPEFGG